MRTSVRQRDLWQFALRLPDDSPNLPGDPPHGPRRFYQQSPRAGDFILDNLGVVLGLLFQLEQPDIDAQQRLRDFILKFQADFLALFFLRHQHLVRQLPQTFLQLQGFLQQLAVVFAADLEGGFHALAPDDAALQLAVGRGQFPRAPARVSFNRLKCILLCRAARCVSTIGMMASVKNNSARSMNPFLRLDNSSVVTARS